MPLVDLRNLDFWNGRLHAVTSPDSEACSSKSLHLVLNSRPPIEPCIMVVAVDELLDLSTKRASAESLVLLCRAKT